MSTTFNRLIVGALFAATLIISPIGTVAGSADSLPPLPGSKRLHNQHVNRFTFFVCGDNRPHEAGDTVPKAFAEIIQAAAEQQPTFILWCGDMIYGHDPTNQNVISGEYQAFLRLADKANVPIFACPGNHEMDDQNDVPNLTMQNWYETYMGPRYGSFDFGNSSFIALDTEEIAPPNIKRSPGLPIAGDKNLDPGYVSPQQLAWLRGVLDRSRNKDNVFIFMHHPIHGLEPKAQLDEASAQAVVDLLAQYPNVAYVFAAHEHLYYNPQDPSNYTQPSNRLNGGPPLYVVTGGAGAPLEKNQPGDFNHYLVINVRGKRVLTELIELNPSP